MGQFLTTTCSNPDCGREKEIYIDGREIRAGERCGGCGNSWEIDVSQFS